MKKITDAILKGSFYAIIIISIFYVFAALSENTGLTLPPSRFALLTCFGLIIAFTNLGVSLLKLKATWREVIRYAVLLVSFILTFTLSGTLDARASSIISVSAVFTLVYLAWLGAGALWGRLNARIPAKAVEKPTTQPKEKKHYKPLYSDNKENN